MKKDLEEWHRRFAWTPTIIGNYKIWMRFYKRKMVTQTIAGRKYFSYWDYEI